MKHTIGVFDSGVGGLSVKYAIEIALPQHEIIFKHDTQNVPYGIKSPIELHKLVLPILTDMVEKGCEVIVVACNSVTTTIINKLRADINIPLIGMEPMIKPAADITKSGIIAVCATPTTLASNRYKFLKSKYAQKLTVLEPDCSDWPLMIENNQIDREKIVKRIEEVCVQGADAVVLGCTHFHWIEDLINEASGSLALIMQPEQPVINQLKRVLAQLD